MVVASHRTRLYPSNNKYRAGRANTKLADFQKQTVWSSRKVKVKPDGKKGHGERSLEEFDVSST